MIELKNPVHWQRAVDSISSFISEGNFRFSDDGISLKALDPSQVVLVDYIIEKASFDKYHVEPNLVGVDIVELSKILLRGFEGDRLLMDLTDSELKIRFEGELSRSFSLPLIDVNEEELKMPDPSFDASVEINARIFKEVLKDASLFGSSVLFSVKGSEFVIEAKGTQGNLKSTIKPSKNLSIKASKDIVSKYSLNFLQNIVKAADSNKKILLELKSDSAMRVSYRIGDSNIVFYLAHMIL